MNASEFLFHAGRIVGYYPLVAKAVGGAKAGILLCQLLFYFKQNDASEISRGLDDLEDETGLTTKELRGARKTLRAGGILTERLARLEHKVYFSIKLANLQESI